MIPWANFNIYFSRNNCAKTLSLLVNTTNITKTLMHSKNFNIKKKTQAIPHPRSKVNHSHSLIMVSPNLRKFWGQHVKAFPISVVSAIKPIFSHNLVSNIDFCREHTTE